MFQFHCPHCGEARDEEEYTNAGEAYIVRPPAPETVDDAAWGDYLFMRDNPKGWVWEQWLHTAGCRKMIVLRRQTATYAVAESRTMADGKPDDPGAAR